MVDAIANLANTSADHLVLDLGAGVGGPARRLARLVGCRVVGLDVMETLVRAAYNHSAEYPTATFAVGTAEALPFRDDCFEQVWGLGVVAHLRDLRGACREIARVLRGGGTACFTEGFWNGRNALLFPSAAPWPWRAVTVSDLEESLAVAGLSHIACHPWPGSSHSSPSGVQDPSLRADLLEARLEPALIMAQNGRSARVAPLPRRSTWS
jgi:SAM-dependent methyltransferase